MYEQIRNDPSLRSGRRPELRVYTSEVALPGGVVTVAARLSALARLFGLINLLCGQ